MRRWSLEFRALWIARIRVLLDLHRVRGRRNRLLYHAGPGLRRLLPDGGRASK